MPDATGEQRTCLQRLSRHKETTRNWAMCSIDLYCEPQHACLGGNAAQDMLEPNRTPYGVKSSETSNSMESQTHVSKQAPRELRNWRVQGNPPTLCQPFAKFQPLANPLPTLRQPFANPLPTFSASPSPTPSFRGPQAPV